MIQFDIKIILILIKFLENFLLHKLLNIRNFLILKNNSQINFYFNMKLYSFKFITFYFINLSLEMIF